MVPYIWWAVLVLSASMLTVLVIRSKPAAAWLVSLGIRVVAAAFLLYVGNAILQAMHVEMVLPINGWTLAAVGGLGLPGLALVVASKAVFVG